MQAILYRVVDIAENTIPLWRNGKIIPVIILSRSLMETVSAAYWLICRISRHMDAGNWEYIDEDIMRLSFSSSTVDKLPNPVNILNFIDVVNKSIPGWRNAYDIMSQSVHPNSDGTIFAYSEVDEKSYDINFFKTLPCTMEWLDKNMPPVLTNSLFLMQKILNDYTDLRPNLNTMLKQRNTKV